MKSKSLLLLILIIGIGISSYSQEKSSKQTKEEQKLAAQQQTKTLLNAKEYVFVGLDAYPSGYRTVSLSGRQNFVKFHPELIESDMRRSPISYNGYITPPLASGEKK